MPKAVVCSSNDEPDAAACTGTGPCGDRICTRGQGEYCFRQVCGFDQCLSDADCADAGGGVCSCKGSTFNCGNVCVPSSCHSDADCGPSGWCSPTPGECNGQEPVGGYYCHQPGDDCLCDTDCGGDGSFGQPYCTFVPQVGKWKCSDDQCSG